MGVKQRPGEGVDQASRGLLHQDLNLTLSITPWPHQKSVAAYSSTDALLRRYNLLPEVEPEKLGQTARWALKPKGRKVSQRIKVSSKTMGPALLALSTWSGKRFLPLKLVHEEQGGFINQSLSPPRQRPLPENLKSTARLEHLSPKTTRDGSTTMSP
ncbi:hypothetical protein DPEC_G00217280 [Dallia pectoralis]|uniref:Uncharacterized protein n=1 Tax=Dallia pectoralis TaxID=75939 RepID=A0ACC2G2Z8_DALPE|nr:hypothetical protein DPEC_G00217280 [Dallia pectoralis]